MTDASFALVTGPASEPVSLADAKDHLRVTGNSEDTILGTLITSARQWAENRTKRALINQTWRCKLDAFPAMDEPIDLRWPPLVSVTSIAYVDSNGDTQTWSSSYYTVHTDRTPGQVSLAYDADWPVTRDQRDAVTITYVAGYGSAASNVPAAIIAAIKLQIGDLYANREAVIADNLIENRTAAALLDPYTLVYLR